jgi:hypothetical protein
MRPRARLAVSGFSCQMGSRTFRTSAVSIASTGRSFIAAVSAGYFRSPRRVSLKVAIH